MFPLQPQPLSTHSEFMFILSEFPCSECLGLYILGVADKETPLMYGKKFTDGDQYTHMPCPCVCCVCVHVSLILGLHCKTRGDK